MVIVYYIIFTQAIRWVCALDQLPGCELPGPCEQKVLVDNCISTEDCCVVVNLLWLLYRAQRKPSESSPTRLPMNLDPYVESYE